MTNFFKSQSFYSIHSSESQQEFFRMLDEKIEKVRSPQAYQSNTDNMNL